MPKYLNLKEASVYLNGRIKSRTLLKYISLGLLSHYRIGIKSDNAKKDTRPIVVTEEQLEELMNKFIVRKPILKISKNNIFPKTNHQRS